MGQRKQAEGETAGQKPALPEINEVNLVGRLMGPARVREFGGDKRRAQFMLAVPRTRHNGEGQRVVQTAYVTVVAWRGQTKQCEGLAKGDAVQVQGCVRTWQDQTKRFHWEIEADNVQVLERQSGAAPEQPELAAA